MAFIAIYYGLDLLSLNVFFVAIVFFFYPFLFLDCYYESRKVY